jgi:hypothetical protein
LELSGVPRDVAKTNASGSQFKGRSCLKTSASDLLIGIVRRLLRVFGGPNSPLEIRFRHRDRGSQQIDSLPTQSQ